MRVVLVGPEREENLSIRYLSSSLLKAGHNVDLAAFDSVDNSQEVMDSCTGADIVGLSMCFQARAREFLELARSIKATYRGVLLVGGGHYASCAARDLLQFHPEIDLIVIHEGEKTFVEIADWHTHRSGSISQIRGIAYRDGTQVKLSPPRPITENLDSLPWPDRRGPVRLVAGVPTAYMCGSRGCLNSCDYCCISTLHTLAPGKQFRQRDPGKIADEMAELYHARGIRQFIFHDDNFLVPSERINNERLNDLSSAWQQRGMKDIGLYIKCRPGDVTRGILQRLRDMGLVRIFMGIESSTSRGLASLGRKQSVAESKKALRICDDLGISFQYTLMIFHPEATIDTILSDIRFMYEHINHPLNFVRAELHTGTPLERRMMEAARVQGNYLARSYTLFDPAAERVCSLWKQIFRERCGGENGVMNRTIRLDYLAAVMKKFYDYEQIRAVTKEIEDFQLRANRSSLDLLTTLVDSCQSLGHANDFEIRRAVNELRRAEMDSSRVLLEECDNIHRKIDYLTLRLVGLEESNGRVQIRNRFRGSFARHFAAVMVALHVAGAISGLSGTEQAERPLDVDLDGLYDDLELQVFGTDPNRANTDADEVPDEWEDHDQDGVANLEEQQLIEVLFGAAWRGEIDIVRSTIASGVELDAIDPLSEMTALISSASRGHSEIVITLLEAGADVDAMDNNGRTALMWAAWRGHAAAATILLEAGADVDIKDDQNSTALIMTAWGGHTKVAVILVEAGADVNASDNFGNTALIAATASRFPRFEIVHALLGAGANVNAADKNGNTVLIRAIDNYWIKHGRAKTGVPRDERKAMAQEQAMIVEELLKAGAEVNRKNADGVTALMLAKQNRLIEIVELLEGTGAEE